MYHADKIHYIRTRKCFSLICINISYTIRTYPQRKYGIILSVLSLCDKLRFRVLKTYIDMEFIVNAMIRCLKVIRF